MVILNWLSGKIEDGLDSDSLFIGLGAVLLLAAIVMVAIGAIVAAVWWAFWMVFGDHTDYGRCFQYHVETSYQPVKTGNVVTVMPVSHNVCDQWEYPSGKGE